MARYKPVDSHLSKLLPVKFSEQILPGTFEYALNWLVDHEVDLSVFDARYRNDERPRETTWKDPSTAVSSECTSGQENRRREDQPLRVPS